MNIGFPKQGFHRLNINAGWLKKDFAELSAAEFFKLFMRIEVVVLEENLAHKGETIGMNAGAWQADENIAGFGFGHNQLILIDRADAETGQIVMFRIVHIGHFSGLAAD